MILLIVATDDHNGIAKNGRQPWSLPGDERYFQETTMSRGGAVLMGRTTFDTLKGPLSGRHNFVATRAAYQAEGITIVSDLTNFLTDYVGDKDIWVIGGAEIYKQTIDQASELYITKIAKNFDCDRFFPDYQVSFKIAYQSDEQSENGVKYSYTRYVKNT